MRTIETMVAVMLAFSGGASIESRKVSSGSWQEIKSPEWNWRDYDYRVKEYCPEGYRPYKTMQEFSAGLAENDEFVYDGKGNIYAVTSVNNTGVVVLDVEGKHISLSYRELVLDYKWRKNDLPCGYKKGRL